MASPAQFLMRISLSGCLFLAASCLASAQVLTVLHSFSGGDGAMPEFETLVQGRDGNLYGTATEGGAQFGGTLFYITPQGALSFYQLAQAEGQNPVGGLVLGIDGLFYGTTQAGGNNFGGVVFRIGPQTSLTDLWTFSSFPNQPVGPITLGLDGNYYGTVGRTSQFGPGAIFKLTPSSTLTVLHTFDSPGVVPEVLVYGPDHAFYGTTNSGGGTNWGTIFRITSSGQFTTMHSFSNTDGSNPEAGLLLADDGNLYGTTEFGGEHSCGGFLCGTIFRFNSTDGIVTVLHSFDGTDGQFPEAGLIQATDGNFYGTAGQTIFSITKGGSFTILHTLDSSEGAGPWGLMQHTNGKFYGTTEQGGAQGLGTIFSLDMGLGPFITFVLPYGRVGSRVQILGQGLTGTTAVTFNGIPATTFQVASDTFMSAIVPPGATTGPVQVTTPGGVLTSNINLQIVP